MLKKTIFGLLIAASLLLSANLQAQTTVTGTVVDPSGIPYAAAQVTASLSRAGATVTNTNAAQCAQGGFGSAPCQVPIQGTVGPSTLDSTGTFTMALYPNASILPAGTQWVFTVNISPGISLPLGTGPQTTGRVPITIAGATQSVSAALSAAAPALTNFAGAPGTVTTPGTGAATDIAIFSAPHVINGSGSLTSPVPGELQVGSGSELVSAIAIPNGTGTAANCPAPTPATAFLCSESDDGDLLLSDEGNPYMAVVQGASAANAVSIGVGPGTAEVAPDPYLSADGALGGIDLSVPSQTTCNAVLVDLTAPAGASLQLCTNDDGSSEINFVTAAGTGTIRTSVAAPNVLELTTFGTTTNCSSSGSPAVCATAAAGSVVVAAAATTVVVDTSAVTANSQILLTYDSSLGTKLGVTCNVTEPALYGVSARTPGTSFTIKATAPSVNPACFSYVIFN